MVFEWLNTGGAVIGTETCRFNPVAGIQAQWSGVQTEWSRSYGNTADRVHCRRDRHFSAADGSGSGRLEGMLLKPADAVSIRVRLSGSSPANLEIQQFILIGQPLALAEDTGVRNWLGTSGEWASGANWDLGVPVSSEDAYIDNGGTAQISTGAFDVAALFIGSGSGDNGGLSLTGGTLAIGGQFQVGTHGTGIGTINVSGGTLRAHTLYVAAQGGIGSVDLSGAFDVSLSSTFDMDNNPASTGRSATLTVNGTVLIVR